LSDYKSYFLKNLKNWTISYSNFQLSSFNASGTTDFSSAEDFDTTTSEWKEFYALYKPALTFSGDGRKFLDIYSYDLNLTIKGNKIVANYSGEQTAELYDFVTGKTSRILFCGISEQIQDVIWTEDSKFILVGREIEDKDKVYPIIYLADLTQRKITCFRCSNKLCIENKNTYSSRKLNRIKYQEE
jgi:hypothetical protein